MPFHPLTTQNIKILKKLENLPADIIILHRCTINDNHMIHSSQDIEHDRPNLLLFWTIFCPFTPHKNPKNQNSEKMEKTPGDIIILHKCTINDNHMMYCSWDMVRDRCNYFSFWAIFCPFTPLTAQKIKILKKWKKHLEISSFYTSVPKIIIICYTVP